MRWVNFQLQGWVNLTLPVTTPELADFDNLFVLQSDADVMKYIGQGVRTHGVVAWLKK